MSKRLETEKTNTSVYFKHVATTWADASAHKCTCVYIDFTIDVCLLMQLGDAQQVCPLLLATDPSLAPWQRSLEVKLVTAVCQWVSIPECLTATAWQWGKDIRSSLDQGRKQEEIIADSWHFVQTNQNELRGSRIQSWTCKVITHSWQDRSPNARPCRSRRWWHTRGDRPHARY